jgi:hypothetical protein
MLCVPAALWRGAKGFIQQMLSFSRKILTPRASATIIRSVNNYPTTTYKSTTGLVGLAVDFDARNTLLDLTAKCLQSVQVCC